MAGAYEFEVAFDVAGLVGLAVLVVVVLVVEEFVEALVEFLDGVDFSVEHGSGGKGRFFVDGLFLLILLLLLLML